MSRETTTSIEHLAALLEGASQAGAPSLVCRQHADGAVGVHLPKRGFGGWRAGAALYWTLGLICLAAAVAGVVLMVRNPVNDRRNLGLVLLFFAAVFGATWYHGLRRRFTRFDAVASPHALLIRTEGFGKTWSYVWSRAEIRCVRVEPVKRVAHDDPSTTALQVFTAAGPVVALLVNHDEDELNTIAAELNRALGSDPVEADDYIGVDVDESPPSSEVRVCRMGDELRLEFPPTKRSALLAERKRLALMSLVIAAASVAVLAMAPPAGFFFNIASGVCGFFGLITLLVGVSLPIIRIQRGIVVASPKGLRITERGLLLSKTREWACADIHTIRAGASSSRGWHRPMLELQVLSDKYSWFGFFGGRDRHELSWAATLLRDYFEIAVEAKNDDES